MYELNPEENEKRMVADPHEYTFKKDAQNRTISEVIAERKRQEQEDGVKKYIPLGSVVSLTDSESDLKVIIGYNCNNGEETFDYVACDYPFGLNENHGPVLFNHDQITRFYHVGFSNPYGKNYRAQMDQEEPNRAGR